MDKLARAFLHAWRVVCTAPPIAIIKDSPSPLPTSGAVRGPGEGSNSSWIPRIFYCCIVVLSRRA